MINQSTYRKTNPDVWLSEPDVWLSEPEGFGIKQVFLQVGHSTVDGKVTSFFGTRSKVLEHNYHRHRTLVIIDQSLRGCAGEKKKFW